MTWYLGIDQSYSGLAMVFLDAETGEYEAHLKKFDPKKYGTGIDRLVDIHDYVTVKVLASKRVGHICMEGYANGAKFGREAAGELGAMVKLALLKNTPVKYPTIVPPTSLKKFVAGKGSGVKKNEMLLATYKRWGADFTDDNLCDAYGLARVAMAIDGGTEHLPGFQTEVIEKLTPHTEKFPK